MPTDGFESVLHMATAFGLVATAAVPVGLVAWRVGRRSPAVWLPVPTVDDSLFVLVYFGVFVGYQILEAMFGSQVVPVKAGQPVLPHDGAWRSVFGSLLAFPLVALGWAWFRSSWSWRAAVWAVAVGTFGWLAVSPGVLVVNAAVEWAVSRVGLEPGEHQLVKVVQSADLFQAGLLIVAVAVAKPFAEEVIFRGLLLGWLTRRPEWGAALVGLAVLLAAGSTAGVARLMAVGFLALTAVGLVGVRRNPTAVAVWATATLFAAVHSSVWPSPVPLFLLGLALGWVAVRTGGVLAGTVLHGLFNGVSLVYLLRG